MATQSGIHAFDQLCQAPLTPQTHCMVERFHGRLAEVLATHRFNSAEDLGTTRMRYVWLYNHPLPQKAIGHALPIETMRKIVR